MPGPIEVTVGYLPSVSEAIPEAKVPENAENIFSPSDLRRTSSSADGAPSWPMPSSRRGSVLSVDNPFQRASSDGFMDAEPATEVSIQQLATAQGGEGSQHEAVTFSRTADGGSLLKRFRNRFRSRRRSKEDTVPPAMDEAQHAASSTQQPMDDPNDMDNVPALERNFAPALLSGQVANALQTSSPSPHNDVTIESKKQQPTLSAWGGAELAAVRQTFAAVKAALDDEKVKLFAVRHDC